MPLFIKGIHECEQVQHTLTQTPQCTHADTLQSFLPAGSALAPEPGLRLPVFLRVSVKCIHMLLRGLRLEGDCFRSDKNHLAPSEEPASQHRTGQHSRE